MKCPLLINIKSFDYFHITEYTLEYHICDKYGCDICARIDRSIRTSNIDANGKTFRDEVCRWMDLPIIYLINKDHFFVNDGTGLYIDNKKPSINELVSNLPLAKEVTSKK